MKHFADAYARALFPRRYDAGSTGLASDGVDVAVGAAWYRLVVGVESLLDAVRKRLRRRLTGTARRPATTQMGCG